MDKSCQSSGGEYSITSSSSAITITNNSSARDHCLKSLNKLSHKISKPIITTKKPSFDHQNHNFNITNTTNLQQSQLQHQNLQAQQQQQNQQQQQQPPVYNINKNDFRDVVQKLTGSPAHERFSTPPPIHPPKPQSSRLQSIRPPPLAHVTNRPPPLINSAIPPHQPPPPQPQPPLNPPMPTVPAPNTFIQRPSAPFSPLPPFPAVHAAAESPVSAYMRYLQNSISVVDSNKQFSGFSPLAPLVCPRWNNLAAQQFPLPHNQQSFAPSQQGILPSPTSGTTASQPQFQLPPSPLPFGCFNSPASPRPLLSPGLLLSPSSFPVSPTLPVPSPKWRGL